MPAKRFSVFIFCACFVLMTACEHKAFDFSSYAAARARWLSYNYTTYQIEQERICFFCQSPQGLVQLFIVDNKVTSGVSAVESRALTSSELESFRTVDQTFDWIEQTRKTKPDHFEIDYDPQYGYPARIEYKQSENALDGGITNHMRNLQVAVFLKSSQERLK